MSLQHPLILYVGDAQAGQALQDAVQNAGWWVYQPTETLEALGMYVTYMPDVVVINAATQPDFTGEVYEHLRSVDARPLLVLTDDPAWNSDTLREEGVYPLATHTSPEQLKSTIRFVLQHHFEERQHDRSLLALAGD